MWNIIIWRNSRLVTNGSWLDEEQFLNESENWSRSPCDRCKCTGLSCEDICTGHAHSRAAGIARPARSAPTWQSAQSSDVTALCTFGQRPIQVKHCSNNNNKCCTRWLWLITVSSGPLLVRHNQFCNKETHHSRTQIDFSFPSNCCVIFINHNNKSPCK